MAEIERLLKRLRDAASTCVRDDDVLLMPEARRETSSKRPGRRSPTLRGARLPIHAATPRRPLERRTGHLTDLTELEA